MRKLILLVFLASCAGPQLAPADRAREISDRLRRGGLHYQVSGVFVQDPDEKALKPLMEEYRDDLAALQVCLFGQDKNARTFSMHALSRSFARYPEEVFARGMEDFVNRNDEEATSAALWYCYQFKTPILLSTGTVGRLLNQGEIGFRRDVVSALRSHSIVPEFSNYEKEPFDFFESLISLLEMQKPVGQEERQTIDYIHELLEDLTTPKMRRESKVVSAIPISESGPFTTRASQERDARIAHWKKWWEKFRQYLAWVPLRIWEEPMPRGLDGFSSHVFLKIERQMRHCELGGGFFILDDEAFGSGIPSAEFRKSHVWKENEGPESSKWYGPGNFKTRRR